MRQKLQEMMRGSAKTIHQLNEGQLRSTKSVLLQKEIIGITYYFIKKPLYKDFNYLLELF